MIKFLNLFLLILAAFAAFIAVLSWPRPRIGVITFTASAPVQATQSYTVTGQPTVSATFINNILCHWQSPACRKGQALYDLGVRYGIDPVFPLAFFENESGFGTQGEARVTKSIGNLRCIPSAACIDQDRGGYAAFPTWETGFDAWYSLIRHLYIEQWKLTTVSQIIHRYAPNSDNNNEDHYASVVEHEVDAWRNGQVA